MELKVFWTRFAKYKLEDIFSYYKYRTGVKTARKIVTGITDETIILTKNPEIGQVEELLKERPQQFRYLVYTNYKIIYRINREKNRIVIDNVFDTRQNPLKIQETKVE